MRSTCRCCRRWLGRRRGWLVLSQLLMIAAIVLLALCNPKISPWYLVFGAALLVAAASATQDIVIDAFRVESLDASEQAAGMASYVAAYRVGMLVSTAGALFIVTGFEDFGFGKDLAWSLGYVTMAAFVAIGIVTALLATEPARSAAIRAEHEKHAAEQSAAARHADGDQRVLRIPHPRDGAWSRSPSSSSTSSATPSPAR